MKFSIKNFCSKCDKIRKTFTEEIHSGKLFLCSESYKQMFRSIKVNILKSKVLLTVTAIVWKTSRLWGFKQVVLTPI